VVEPEGGGGGGGRRRSAAKHRAILDAAFAVFCAQGYARTSVDAIAAEAGVGKQTVYGHFGDKQRLFLAAVDDARSAFPGLGDPVTDTGDPLADLTAAGERILHAVLSPRVSALHRLAVAELPHHPELRRVWRDTADPATKLGIAPYLRACQQAGTLEVPDPARAARQFACLLIAEARVATLHGTEPLAPVMRRAIAAATADLIVRAHRS
jgi:TetR/AcrR family transcriptional repressor of mexJK operon